MNQDKLPWKSFVAEQGLRFPLICGAMYPCSNPELVAAASASGGMGIVQPLSLTYVYGYKFREGLKKIRSLTDRPIGLNVLIEASSKVYLERMRRFVDEALEENVRFFITALGNPKWVVERVESAGARVFHDVTDRKWALKGVEGGVHGLICVNKNAGGHAGQLSAIELYRQVEDLGLPLVCAGGVANKSEFKAMLELGYSAVQMGTRFIASEECSAPPEYKAAILKAVAKDIVLSNKLTGVPVAVIENDYVRRLGPNAGALAAWMLRHPRFKHWVRSFYALKSFYDLKKSMHRENGYDGFWQAGKSVENIHQIESVDSIVKSLCADLD